MDIIVDNIDKETKAKSEKPSNFKVTQLTNGRDRIWKQTYLIENSIKTWKILWGKTKIEKKKENKTKIETLSYR